MNDEDMNKLRELNRSFQTETIAPPRWWITFTPYSHAVWEFRGDEGEMERFIKSSRVVYTRESKIFLMEWLKKYALTQVIKELMDDGNSRS